VLKIDRPWFDSLAESNQKT